MQAVRSLKTSAEHRVDLASVVTQKIAAAQRVFERTGAQSDARVCTRLSIWLARLAECPR